MIITIATKPKEFKIITYPKIRKNSYKISNYGDLYSILNNDFLSPFLDKNSYEKINLRGEETEYISSIGIHQLVAWEFCEGYDESVGRIIPNHLDGIKTNNYFENLEWTTTYENNLHGIIHGNKNSIWSYDLLKTKTPEELVIMICKMFEDGKNPMNIMNYFGIQKWKDSIPLYNFIDNLYNRRKWNNITKNFNWEKIKNVKYSDKFIHELCQYIQDRKTNSEILNIYGYNSIQENIPLSRLISNLREKRCYVYISNYYNF